MTMSIQGEAFLVMSNHTCENCNSLDYVSLSLPGNMVETTCSDCGHIEIIKVPHSKHTSAKLTKAEVEECKAIYAEMDWKQIEDDFYNQ